MEARSFLEVPFLMVPKTLLAVLLLSASVWIVAGATQAQSLDPTPPPCPGDAVLGGDTTTPPDGTDDTALELHVASSAQRFGTWRAFTANNGAEWLPDERGLPVASWQTACTYESIFAFRTFKDQGGEGVEYHIAGTNPPEPTGTTRGDGLDGYAVRTGGSPGTPGITKTTGTTSLGIPFQRASYAHVIDSGIDKFRIDTDITLYGTTRQDSIIHNRYTVCHTGGGYASIGLKNYVALQTGLSALNMERDEINAYGASLGTFEKTAHGYRDNEFPTTASVALRTNLSDTQAKVPIYALMWKHDGWTTPDDDLLFYPTMPTRFLFADETALAPRFDPPTGTGTVSDGSVAWFWGLAGDEAIQLAPMGTPGDCVRFNSYFGTGKATIVPDRPPPPNGVPVADLKTVHQGTTCEDSRFIFDATGSTDPDTGVPTEVRWNFGDGTRWPEGGGFAAFSDPENRVRTKLYEEPGSYTVQLTVSDGSALHTVVRIVDSIGDPNCQPVIVAPEPADAQPGKPMELKIQASDHEGDRIRFTVMDAPLGLEIDRWEGIVRWIPPLEERGYDFRACADDERPPAEPVCVTVEVNVAPPPEPAGLTSDRDGDGLSDASDNCYLVKNRDQRDSDNDGVGDACDPDYAKDTSGSEEDGVAQPAVDEATRCDVALHGDLDEDGLADPCDKDIDNDGVLQEGPFPDNCPFVVNAGQQDADDDGVGDACDGSDGAGYANMAQEGTVCRGCPEPVSGQPVRRVQSSSLGLLGIGLGVGIVVAAATTGLVLYRRR